MCHLASNFNKRFKDKTLKDLLCRVAMKIRLIKFCAHMQTIEQINDELEIA